MFARIRKFAACLDSGLQMYRRKLEAFFGFVLVADEFMLPPEFTICHFDSTLRFQSEEADAELLRLSFTIFFFF